MSEALRFAPMRTAALALLVVFTECKRSGPDVEARLRDALTAGVPGIVIARGEEGVLVVKRGAETVMELTLDPIVRACAKSPEECD